ncbi:hypothetical protein L596_008690 [Steinernema carpocapsae]|uniref:C2H2-type domain-containing protein n=1 Tax=Steinernema carpocapsae TaxID=34508 RepID=A0A4V6A6D5_STECR|nr:hypothetical protein L596_008690 [Steinernema carpocapsae]
MAIPNRTENRKDRSEPPSLLNSTQSKHKPFFCSIRYHGYVDPSETAGTAAAAYGLRQRRKLGHFDHAAVADLSKRIFARRLELDFSDPPSGSFSLGSALFNSDLSADHPGLLRSETAGATSAMQMQSDKWLTYREERTRSSSSDSGVTSQFSPRTFRALPRCPSVRLPNASRFVFPVAQNPLSRNVSLGHDSVFGEAVAPSTSPDTKTLEESLLRIRTVSESIEQIDEFSDEIKQSIAKKPLERKTSVIHPTPTRPIPQKGNVFRSESLPVRFPTIVENPDHPVIQPHNEFANSVNMLMTFQRMMHVNPFLTAALSPNIQIPVHSKSVSPVTPFDPTQQPTPLEELSVDGKRQYICRYCKKDFKRPDILSRHLRRHTGEKPFHCEDCGRYFSRSDHLRTHQRTHTDEKPYKCTHCPYAARRRDVLTRHMSTKHQAKAGKSVFQRHRTVRRCVSDGDVSLATSASATNPRELTPVEVIVARSSPLIKRERHTTELALPTQPLIHAPRARHVTEIPSMSQEDMPDSDLDEDELEDEDSEDVESVIDVTKIEDDVIVDEEMPEHVPEEGVESIQEPQS